MTKVEDNHDGNRRILILTNNSGGLYHFRAELIQKLIDLGHEVYFALPEPEDDGYVKLIMECGAKHILTPIKRRSINFLEEIKLIKTYKSIIHNINPHLVLTYTIKPNIYGTYAAKKYRKPVIMNITGIGHSLYGGIIKNITKKLYKYACGKADIVFFQNYSNSSFFISEGMVNQSKIKHIPGSGVNTGTFQPVKKNTDDSIVRFLYIGRIMKEKGIDEFLEAAKEITEVYDNVEFLLIGNFEEEQYKDIVMSIDNPKIQYFGYSRDIRNEIKDVDCIVNPSYHEGMSNVLLEGAAMGKPLIASNIPGCKEIIEEGKNGFLFNVRSADSLKEKIVHFLELTPEERIQMGQYSRKKTQLEFDRNIVIDEYIKAINTICS